MRSVFIDRGCDGLTERRGGLGKPTCRHPTPAGNGHGGTSSASEAKACAPISAGPPDGYGSRHGRASHGGSIGGVAWCDRVPSKVVRVRSGRSTCRFARLFRRSPAIPPSDTGLRLDPCPERPVMALDKIRISNQIVCLEVTDGRHVAMDAGAYRRAARELRHAIRRELGELPMRAFVIDALPSVQTTAENVFFDHHRRFADLDGSGGAGLAQALTDRMLLRLRRP